MDNKVLKQSVWDAFKFATLFLLGIGGSVGIGIALIELLGDTYGFITFASLCFLAMVSWMIWFNYKTKMKYGV